MTGRAVDLGAMFDEASRSVVRIETLPFYAGDTLWEAHLAGEPRPERSVLTNRYLRRVRDAVRRGVTWERLRVVSSPPTDYERHELVAYAEGQALGERVHIATRDQVGRLYYPGDAWLVDDVGVGMDYSPDGVFRGSWVLSASERGDAAEDAEHLRHVGAPLNTYLARLAGAPVRRAS